MAASKAGVVRIAVISIAVVAAVVFGIRWWTHGRFIESTDNAYVRADITVITPRVAGEVLQVNVRNNQAVKKGELLLKVDGADYTAKLANARAAIAMREASLDSNAQNKVGQAAMVDEARASLRAAEADRVRVEKDWKRSELLVSQGVATHQRLETALASYKSAVAAVAKAQAGVIAAEQSLASVDSSRAQVDAELDAARASVSLAEIDLASTEIRAPIDGVIGDLAARVGERVNVSQRLLSVVPLAQVYIEANFKETQLTEIAIGQRVEIEVDAFPGRKLAGHVDSLAPASGAEFALLPPENATGNFNKIVQRVPVKILFDGLADLAGLLRPGMSVEAKIDTRTAVKP